MVFIVKKKKTLISSNYAKDCIFSDFWDIWQNKFLNFEECEELARKIMKRL